MADPTVPSTPDPDAQLVAKMASGDQAAVGLLYDRFGAQMYGLAFRILGEAADAEEAVMEGFAQAWRQASRFERSRGSVGAWLTVVVRSRALDRARAAQRRDQASRGSAGTPETAGVAQGPGDPADLLVASEDQNRVRAAIRQLGALQQSAIELAFFDGLTHSQIAAQLDTPLGTIKTRIRDGMRKLRDILEPHYSGVER